MKTIKLSNASRTLAEYAADLTDEIILVTKDDRPLAALVPLKRSDLESIRLSAHPEFLKVIRRSRSEFRRGRTIPLAEMKAVFADRSPNKRLQPSKARRRNAAPSRSGTRLRG